MSEYEHMDLIAALNRFRVGEASGEEAVGAWIAVCENDYLRGGLRTIQEREGLHARLLGQRISELTGAPPENLAQPDFGDALEMVAATMGDADVSDLEKVLGMPGVLGGGDPEKEVYPEMRAIADTLLDDPETQALLITILSDEVASVEFFRDVYKRLTAK